VVAVYQGNPCFFHLAYYKRPHLYQVSFNLEDVAIYGGHVFWIGDLGLRIADF
jgi:hypothetical protein